MPSYQAGAPAPILPDGAYPFEVIACKLKTSSNNNEMFELILEFPMHVTVFDYLVFNGASGWKIDQFRESIGDEVVSGEVELRPTDFLHRKGSANLKTEEFDGRKRNKIESYIIADRKHSGKGATVPATAPEPDDIPY
jgi:hypothetical protein